MSIIRISEEVSSFANVKLNECTAAATAAAETSTTPTTPFIKKQILPVTIYDFNGSLTRYAHLADTFLDKHALIIVCVDCSRADDDQHYSNLVDLLDVLFLKMSKTTSFKILPVLTKCDVISGGSSSAMRQACERVETLIAETLSVKLSEIRVELKKIESLPQINASQSDRLKHLAQTQSNLMNPDVYGQCIPVGSVKMQGIEQLAGVIRQIVLAPESSKIFGDVNKKVPVFWTEVENYACNSLSEMPSTKNLSENGKFKWTQPQTMNMFCMEYTEFKVIFLFSIFKYI